MKFKMSEQDAKKIASGCKAQGDKWGIKPQKKKKKKTALS